MELKNTLVGDLLKQADRFCCVIEMAAYLAMVMLGGPKKCLLWYCDEQGNVVDNPQPDRAMQESLTVCQDDVELALLFIKQFQAHPTDEKRVRWCKQWRLNYATLLAVDLLMNRLLGERICRDEGDHEVVRSIDLRLIDKLRLLIFYHVARGDQEGQPGISYSTSRHTLRIHRDSICYGRKVVGQRCLYFSSAPQEERKEVEAEQVILLPDWCPEPLRIGKYDEFDLAWLIARKTRRSNDIEVPSRWDARKPGKQPSFLGEDLRTLIEPFAVEKQDRLAKDVIKVAKYVGYQGAADPSTLPGGEVLQRGETYEATVVRIFPYPYNYAQVKLRSGQYGFLYALSGEEDIDVFTDERLSVEGTITVCFTHRDEETGHLFFKPATGELQGDLKEKAIVTMVSRNKARVCLESGVFAVLSEVKKDGRSVPVDMSKKFVVGQEIKVEIIEITQKNVPGGGKRTTYVSTDIE